MKNLMLLIPLLFTGCVHTAGIVEQLKNDPATVDLNIQTMYGSISLHRAFPTNYSVTFTNYTVIITNPATK